MEFEQPPDEAYGRVTNPERYQAVVDATKEMIASLVENFEVSLETGTAAADFPHWHKPEAHITRLTPATGMSIAVMYTDFPGVVLAVGELHSWGLNDAFPSCGCDACDDKPEEMIDEIRELLDAAVGGSYREGLTKKKLWRAWGGRGNWRGLRHGEWKQYGEPRELSWEPWPRRRPS